MSFGDDHVQDFTNESVDPDDGIAVVAYVCSFFSYLRSRIPELSDTLAPTEPCAVSLRLQYIQRSSDKEDMVIFTTDSCTEVYTLDWQ